MPMATARFAAVVPLRKLPPNRSRFTYRIPDELAVNIIVGSFVRIPFMRSIVDGVVLDIAADPYMEAKDIAHAYGTGLTAMQVALVKHLAQQYYQSPATIIHSFIAALPRRGEIVAVQHAAAAPAPTPASYEYCIAHRVRDIQDIIREKIAAQSSGQTAVIIPEYAWLPSIKEALQQQQPLIIPPKTGRREFFQAWQRSSTAAVVIGGMHALFLPYSQLRQIIIVEAEHQGFKKAEQNPRYHLADFILDVAARYGAHLTLTGFSPDIRLVAAGRTVGSTLSERGRAAAPLSVVDMQEERRAGSYHPLSHVVQEVLQRKKQRILFLSNRRGDARITRCADCGFVVKCDRCDRPLVQLQRGNQLDCLACGTHASVPTQCPQCKGVTLQSRGNGIAAIARSIQKLIPDRAVSIYSRDADTLPTDAAVVVATNKIFSLPHLQFDVAVVVNADDELQLPNLYAAEQTRSHIMKLRSRANEVFVQTYSPSQYCFQTLDSTKDFLAAELAWRKRLGYPPFGMLITVTVKTTHQAALAEPRARLQQHFANVHPYGPFTLVKARHYEAQIVIKVPTITPELDAVLRCAYTWSHIEINPYELGTA